MFEVTKEVFFSEVDRWGAEGKDPMPSRIEKNWKCQKTNKVFGRIDSNGYGKHEYFLNEVQA